MLEGAILMPSRKRIAELRISWLQAFALLAETGSASETARRLDIHQSSVSRYIQALHEWTGQQLTTQNAPDPFAPYQLTEDGRSFLTTANLILDTLACVAAPAKVKSNLPKRGYRKFVRTPEMDDAILAAVQAFRDKHPDVPEDTPLRVTMGKKGLIVTLR